MSSVLNPELPDVGVDQRRRLRQTAVEQDRSGAAGTQHRRDAHGAHVVGVAEHTERSGGALFQSSQSAHLCGGSGFRSDLAGAEEGGDDEDAALHGGHFLMVSRASS